MFIQIPDSICLSMDGDDGPDSGFDRDDRIARAYIASAVFKMAVSVACVCSIICSKSSCRAIINAKSLWRPTF